MPTAIAAIASALLLAMPVVGPAQASDAPRQKKLYCWNQGSERICSDALPSDAVNNAREEFNASSGTRSGQVQRALTDAERAQAIASQAQQQLDDMARQTRLRTEQALLANYPDEAALRRVFNERTGILDNSISTARFNVDSLRRALAGALATAGDRELAGAEVTEKQAATVQQRHMQLRAQLRLQRSFEQQRAELQAEIEQTLARFRQLKAPPEAAG